ncbi:hypothetical protein MHU86_23569 [Fragilaria crotonensis]|nr:hypothetical protein MHU86_23569 [Fragilaria crotonensis]
MIHFSPLFDLPTGRLVAIADLDPAMYFAVIGALSRRRPFQPIFRIAAFASATWRIWERFCIDSGIRTDLRDIPGDHVPNLLLFAHQYRTGRIAPSDRPVRSRTVEDAVRHVAHQAFTRVGAVDPRLNTIGDVDFRLHALFHSWKKSDPPSLRVKPLPLLVLHHAHRLAATTPNDSPTHAAGDYLLLAFYFLLRPGEYSGTPQTDADDLFRVQDTGVWIGHRRLNPLLCPSDDLVAATFVIVTFTTQKNGVRGETLGHGRSGHLTTLCPVAALTRRLLHLRLVGVTPTTPLNAYRSSATARWRFVVLPTDYTSLLRFAVALFPSSLTDFSPRDVSACSRRAGGAMAMLCGGIDSERIRLIGRWRSDEKYRYLHVPSPTGDGRRRRHHAAWRRLPPQLPTHLRRRRRPTHTCSTGPSGRGGASHKLRTELGGTPEVCGYGSIVKAPFHQPLLSYYTTTYDYISSTTH